FPGAQGGFPPPRPVFPDLTAARGGLGADAGDETLAVREHRPTYFLPARYSTNVNQVPVAKTSHPPESPPTSLELQSTEMKFQYSLKARLARSADKRWAWWVGYTQQSHWQVYNG